MTDAVAKDQLKAFVARIERLDEERKTISLDIKDVYGEAKSLGFVVKILRKMDADDRANQEAVLDVYLAALDMIQPGLFQEAAE